MMHSSRNTVDVSILLQDLRGGGAERASLRLARGMIEQGRTVDITLVRKRNDYESEVPDGVRLVVLDASRVAGGIHRYSEYLNKTKPKSIISAITHVNIAAIAARMVSRHKPTLVVTERNQLLTPYGESRTPTDRTARALAPWVYRYAETVVCVSEALAVELRKRLRIASKKVVAIHNPAYDPYMFSASHATPQHPWCIPSESNKKTIIAAGRLVPQKGYDSLIAAFIKVREKIDSRLLIFGIGPEREALQVQARISGLDDSNFCMPGFSGNLISNFSGADLFVLPSRYEGFPNVLVEAMACGVPVVATDCFSGPREIYAPDQINKLVPVDDVEKLAQEMIVQLTRPSPSEHLKCRASTFSVETAARKYLEVLGV